MCAPPLIAAAATAVKAGGAAFSALQSAAMSRYQAKIADRNAGLEIEAGHNAILNNQTEAARLYRKIGQTQGQQAAAMAANGVDGSFGSALQVQQDAAALGAEDVGQLYKQGAETVRGFDIQASNYKAQAASDRADAHGALIKGVFDVGSTILDGASQFNKLKAKAA